MVNYLTKKKVAISAATTFLLVAIFTLTNPMNVPLAVYTIPFVCFAVLAYLLIETTLNAFAKQRSNIRIKVISGFGAGLPTLLLLLQSIGQLTLRDFLIAVGIIAGIVFYFNRLNFIE